MRLNPKKCVFGIVLEKFLGYLISARGIEANLDKDTSPDQYEASYQAEGDLKIEQKNSGIEQIHFKMHE